MKFFKLVTVGKAMIPLQFAYGGTYHKPPTGLLSGVRNATLEYWLHSMVLEKGKP